MLDCAGVPVGTVEQLLSDPRTHRPAWLVVRLDSGRRTVVPTVRLRPTVAGPCVAYAHDLIAACPAGPEYLAAACRHYGLGVRTASYEVTQGPSRVRSASRSRASANAPASSAVRA